MAALLQSVLALALLSLAGTAGADAPGPRAPEPPPSVSVPESAPMAAADYGQIIFFPASESRPSDERFKVQAGQSVPVCVRLSKNASAYVDKLRDRSVGYLLIMEDSAEPPHRLSITFGNRLKPMPVGPGDCYGGQWQVPQTAVPGNYQVADLFWMAKDESFYSLRNYLYEFSKVEELEVSNPKADGVVPKLVRIRTFHKSPYQMQNYSGVLRVRLEQIFEFQDPESGLDKTPPRIFYRVDVDGTTADLLDAKCRPIAQTNRSFRCVMNFTNPEIIWALNKVHLTLQSVSIEDRAGNRLVLEGEEAICQAVSGAETSFLFERKKKLRDEPRFDLQKDPNVPPPRDF